MQGVKVQSWKRSITYYASAVEVVHSAEDIIRIVKDTGRYPSPVRVKGSHHSTTRCIVAEQGTVIDVTKMNRILDVNEKAKTITMQAGVLHIDAARELEKRNLQFFMNVEIGNLTVGSGACGATKDASYFSEDLGGYEFGQVRDRRRGHRRPNSARQSDWARQFQPRSQFARMCPGPLPAVWRRRPSGRAPTTLLKEGESRPSTGYSCR